MIQRKDIPQPILDILAAGRIEADIYYLPQGQLPRADYEAVNEALTGIGGKWNRSKKGHTFTGNIGGAHMLEEILRDGKQINLQQETQFFETPSAVAERMCEWAGLKRCSVLEPSAGCGAIATVAAKIVHGTGFVQCIEKENAFCQRLTKLGLSVDQRDFLETRPTFLYDRVVMNPPFTKGQDMAHVRHAFDFLRPGGVLVAITSPHFRFADDKQSVEFRQWFEALNGEIEELPDGTFAESGTNVRTLMIRIEKPV